MRRMTLPNVDDNQLNFNDAPRIAWILVQDALKLLSPHNPKLHDLGSIIESVSRYGLQELPKWDATVNWIKAGNGRVEAIAQMEKLKDNSGGPAYKLPRGMAVTKDGKWAMPLVIGVDAQNESEAKAYLLDSNNLTMMGGDYSPYEIAKMWDVNAYNALLQTLAADGVYSVSMNEESVETFDAVLKGLLLNLPEVNHEGGEARRTKITLVLDLSEVERLEEIVEAVREFLDQQGYKVGVDV